MKSDGQDEPARVRSFPELRGERVLLRVTTDEDVVPLWEATVASTSELIPWLAWCHVDYSQEEAASWVGVCQDSWKTNEMFYFLVTQPPDGRILGSCALNQVDWLNRRANLGYWVRTGEQGRGVATQASRLLARYGLEDLGLTRIEIVIGCGNVASERVAVKTGAMREGVLRNRLWLQGRVVDAVSYSLTPENLAQLRQ